MDLMSKQTFKEQKYPLPNRLKSMQEWFAGVMTTPLAQNQTIQSQTVNGSLIAEEAARYIIPNPLLQSHQRMQIYNQQYWWRLLKTLHKNFPLVTRLFGTQVFNEKIGIPYLLQSPPNHWSLNVLGERLPQWIKEFYQEADQSLVLNSAHLDWAFMVGFIAAEHPSPDFAQLIQESPEGFLAQPIYLQPYIHLLTWEYDLLAFRNGLLKREADDWLEHPFPDLPSGKTYFFILYRSLNHHFAWRKISKEQFLLLEHFKKGTTIDSACQYIESQDPCIYEHVASHWHKWLQDWARAKWLTFTPSNHI